MESKKIMVKVRFLLMQTTTSTFDCGEREFMEARKEN